jgi:hypothetical protein
LELTRTELEEIRQLFGDSPLTEMEQLASLIRNGIIFQREELERQRKESEEKDRWDKCMKEVQEELEIALADIPPSEKESDSMIRSRLWLEIVARKNLAAIYTSD